MSVALNPTGAGRTDKADDPEKSQNGLTHRLIGLLETADGKNIEFGTVVSALSGGSHAVLIVFLSFPLCLPVGIPVLSTTLGLALGFVGLLLAMGRQIWIPKSLSAKIVPYERLHHAVGRLLRFSSRIDRWFHPRISLFTLNTTFIRIHGLFVMLLGLVGAIPLPLPFNNFVAAFPLLLLGFSLLEKDGLLAIVSYFSAIPFFLYYGALVYLGNAGFQRLMGF
jgi:hypothetical protein